MLSDSTDLFQRLSLGESLRRTVAVYREGFVVLSQIGLCAVTVQVILWSALLLILLPAFGIEDASEFSDPDYVLGHMVAFYGLLLCYTTVGVVVGAVANGAMIRVVADIYLQRRASFHDCVSIGARHACTIITSKLIALLAVMVGFVALIAPGLYLSVAFFLANPAIVVEGLGVFASLKRSYNLVSGSWCYVFCTYFIATTFMMITQSIWGAIFTGGNDPSHTIFSFFGSIVASMPEIVFGPICAAIMSIMYFNLRIEKEALNADRLARDLGESSGDSTAYSSLIDKTDILGDDAGAGGDVV